MFFFSFLLVLFLPFSYTYLHLNIQEKHICIHKLSNAGLFFALILQFIEKNRDWPEKCILFDGISLRYFVRWCNVLIIFYKMKLNIFIRFFWPHMMNEFMKFIFYYKVCSSSTYQNLTTKFHPKKFTSQFRLNRNNIPIMFNFFFGCL